MEISLKLSCPDNCRLPSDVETTLYRIAQEAVTNSVRHSAANNIRVGLRCDSDTVDLIVEDNGCGFDVNAKLSDQSFGILSIRERAWLVGGQSIFHSTPGAGSRLTVHIPLSLADETNAKNPRLGS